MEKLSTVHVDNFKGYPLPRKNVEKLSTVHVDNFKGYPPVHDSVEKLSTTIVDKSEKTKEAKKTRQLLHNSGELSTISGSLSTFYALQKSSSEILLVFFLAPFFLQMWIMWKSYPPELWITTCNDDRNVDNVEKLSTRIVDNNCMFVLNVDNVEKLSTAIVEKSPYFRKMWIMWKSYPPRLWITPCNDV